MCSASSSPPTTKPNRRALPHRLERCGYTSVRNPTSGDGRWKVQGKNQVVYTKASLSLREQLTAAGALKA
jgi:hypothetical protein